MRELRLTSSREFGRSGGLKNDWTAPLKTPQRRRLVYKLSTLESIRGEQAGLVCKPGRPVFTRLP